MFTAGSFYEMKPNMNITPELAAKCDRLEQIIALYLKARTSLTPSYRQYEANSEAVNLFSLAIRYVEGVITLARTDLSMLPPAEAAARGAFESSVKAAWLVEPSDCFEREARWVAHLKGEEEYLTRQINLLASFGCDTTPWTNRQLSLNKFREEVSQLLLKRGYTPLAKVPNFRDMLRSLGTERTYLLYSAFSQTAHGTHSSTWLYRSGGVGTQKTEGEFVSHDKWDLPVNICRFIFQTPATTMLRALGGDVTGLQDLVEESLVLITH